MRVGTKGFQSATITINTYIVGSMDDHYKRISQTPCGIPLLCYLRKQLTARPLLRSIRRTFDALRAIEPVARRKMWCASYYN